MGEIKLFRIVRSEETRVETVHPTMGWGVQFPSGLCYVDWNREAYAADDRLDHPHVSQYGGIDDVEQGTGGTIQMMHVERV